MALPDRYFGGGLDRRTSRELARLDRKASLEIERSHREAMVSAARMDALGFAGTAAMAQTHALGSVEGAFAAQQPHNAHRLAYVADRCTEGMAEEIVDLKWRLR